MTPGLPIFNGTFSKIKGTFWPMQIGYYLYWLDGNTITLGYYIPSYSSAFNYDGVNYGKLHSGDFIRAKSYTNIIYKKDEYEVLDNFKEIADGETTGYSIFNPYLQLYNIQKSNFYTSQSTSYPKKIITNCYIGFNTGELEYTGSVAGSADGLATFQTSGPHAGLLIYPNDLVNNDYGFISPELRGEILTHKTFYTFYDSGCSAQYASEETVDNDNGLQYVDIEYEIFAGIPLENSPDGRFANLDNTCVFDNKLWLIPRNSTELVSVAPDGEGSYTLTGYDRNAIYTGIRAFAGGAVYDDKLWLIPYNSTKLVSVEPDGEGSYILTGYDRNAIYTGGYAFTGGAVYDNKLWLIPRYSSKLVSVEPDGEGSYILTGYDRNAIYSGLGAFSGGAVYDDKLWLIPNNSTKLASVEPDGVGGYTLTGYDRNAVYTGGAAFFGGAVYDDKLWLIPFLSTKLVSVTTDGTMTAYDYDRTLITTDVGGDVAGAFAGGVVFNNKLWMIPYHSQNLVSVTTDGTMTAYDRAAMSTAGAAFAGGAVFDKKLWMMPHASTALVYMIDPESKIIFSTKFQLKNGDTYSFGQITVGLTPQEDDTFLIEENLDYADYDISVLPSSFVNSAVWNEDGGITIALNFNHAHIYAYYEHPYYSHKYSIGDPTIDYDELSELDTYVYNLKIRSFKVPIGKISTDQKNAVVYLQYDTVPEPFHNGWLNDSVRRTISNAKIILEGNMSRQVNVPNDDIILNSLALRVEGDSDPIRVCGNNDNYWIAWTDWQSAMAPLHLLKIYGSGAGVHTMIRQNSLDDDDNELEYADGLFCGYQNKTYVLAINSNIGKLKCLETGEEKIFTNPYYEYGSYGIWIGLLQDKLVLIGYMLIAVFDGLQWKTKYYNPYSADGRAFMGAMCYEGKIIFVNSDYWDNESTSERGIYKLTINSAAVLEVQFEKVFDEYWDGAYDESNWTIV